MMREQRRIRRCPLLRVLLILAPIVVLFAARASAQIGEVQVIEWDLPLAAGDSARSLVINDVAAGATSPVWYTASGGAVASRLIRFTPGKPIETTDATWVSWGLSALQVSGIRIAPGQLAFVRTDEDIQRINTLTNQRVRYVDGPEGISLSDLAIDPANHIYTAAPTNADVSHAAAPAGLVQRLTPVDSASECAGLGVEAPCARVTRWTVGGGAGGVPLAGVVAHPGTGKLVYFAEPDPFANAIGELDTNTSCITGNGLPGNSVRHFPIAAATGALEPRQMSIDRGGVVFAITMTGHIVRLNPKKNEMTVYVGPGTLGSGPLGIGSHGVVGFSESTEGKEIGMLVPDGTPLLVTPIPDCAPFTTSAIQGTVQPTDVTTGTAKPTPKQTTFLATGVGETGVFVEATLPDIGQLPIGIARDPGPLGTFFYAVAEATMAQEDGVVNNNRIGRVTLPTKVSILLTGDGTIPTFSGTADFSFLVHRKDPLAPIKGNLSYTNDATGDDLVSVAITDLTVVDDTATFSGLCTNNGLPCTFTAVVTDNFTLGIADSFQITPVVGTPASGTVGSGSVRIRIGG